MIILDKVTHWYNPNSSEAVKALEDVSLQIESGEFIVILGHNGSGKSTLSKLFNALIVPHEGSVTIDGLCTSEEQFLYDIRSKVGMVFQNPDSQLVASTVEEEIAFGPENLGVAREEIIERIDMALAMTSMQSYRMFAPHRLSGGQKQKVAIASVLAMQPRYLILDEPTSMLDPKGQTDVLNTVIKLNKEEKISVLLVTQHMYEAFAASRVVVLNRGRLAYDGPPESLFSDHKKLSKLGLDLPPLGMLSSKLSKSGIPISSAAFTVEQVTCELLEFARSRRI